MIRVEMDANFTEPRLTERLVDVLEPREEILFEEFARLVERHLDGSPAN